MDTDMVAHELISFILISVEIKWDAVEVEEMRSY